LALSRLYAYMHRIWTRNSALIAAILVFLAASAAFWIRAQQYFNVAGGLGAVYPEAKLDELDTFINYWIVKYMDENGPASFYSLTRDNPATCLFWYPECRDIAHSELPGHIFTIYALYQLVKPFGVDLIDLMALLTPFIGSLGVVFAALAVKEATKSDIAAVTTAFAYAFMFYSREVAGFTVKYSFGLFTAPLMIWLHLRLLKKPSIVNAVIAGLGIAYAASVWTGVGLSAIPVYISLALAPLVLDLSTRESLVRYSIPFAIEVAIATLVMWLMPPYRGGRAIIWIALLAAFALYAVGAAIQMLLGRRGGAKIYATVFGALAVAFIALVSLMSAYPEVLEAVTRVIPVAGKILLGLGIRPGGVAETVAEYQPGSIYASPQPHMLILLLTTVFLVAPLAVYDMLKQKSVVFLSLAVWGFFSWYATYNTMYFDDYSRLASVVVAGMAIGRLLAFSTPTIRHVGRYVKIGMGMEKIIAAILAIAIVISSINIAYASSVYYNKYTMISHAEGFQLVTDVWLRVLYFLKHNTSKNSLVISWWDYGYWLSVIGNRSTLADGATINSYKIHRLAQYFTYDFSDYHAYLEEFGVCGKDDTYIVIFSPVDVYVDTYSQVLYIAYPVSPYAFGDMAKFVNAIIYLATGMNPFDDPSLRYKTSTYSYDIYESNWMVVAMPQQAIIREPSFVALNINSSTVLNATMPRLFMWASSEKLKEMFPDFKLQVVPALLGKDGDSPVLYIDTLLGRPITFGYTLDPEILGKGVEDIYEIAYVGVSQPFNIAWGLNIYRYVFIVVLKLRENVLSSICG